MKLLLAFVIILAVSILGSRFTFLDRKHSLGFRNILFTGTEYIFIGVLLGNMGLDLLDTDALQLMEPFMVLGLSWVGFLFGLQFKIQKLKTLPGYYFYISAVQALVTFLVTAGAMYWVLKRNTALSENVLVMAALTLGATAAGTAQSALAIVGQNYKFKNRRLLDLMRYISGIDGIYALIFFTAALSIFPAGEILPFDIYRSLIWLGVSIALGVVPALILIALGRTRFAPQEFLVFLIGTVIFCGGMAYQLNYSPLLSGLVCGIVTANFCRHHMRAFSELLHAEKSIYIIMLLLLGAGWRFSMSQGLLYAAVYVAVRFLGKYIGALTGARVFKPDYPVPTSLGLALISDGGVTIAIIINFNLLFPAISAPLVTIVIFSVFFNELISPWLILGRFDKNEREPVNVRRKLRETRQKG